MSTALQSIRALVAEWRKDAGEDYRFASTALYDSCADALSPLLDALEQEHADLVQLAVNRATEVAQLEDQAEQAERALTEYKMVTAAAEAAEMHYHKELVEAERVLAVLREAVVRYRTNHVPGGDLLATPQCECNLCMTADAALAALPTPATPEKP